MKTIFSALKTVFELLSDAFIKAVILFDRNLNLYFEKHQSLHWLFCGLSVLLALYGHFTGDIFDLISSIIICYLCCPLKILPFVPGIIRYLTIGLLIGLQIIRGDS
jgi:hypothetical protein